MHGMNGNIKEEMYIWLDDEHCKVWWKFEDIRKNWNSAD